MVDRIKRRFDLDERREAPILLHRGIAAERLVEDRDLGLGGGGCFSHGCQGGCAGERARKKEPHIELMVQLCRFGEWLAESGYRRHCALSSRPCTGCARRPWGHF
jgi:hypothetical protein